MRDAYMHTACQGVCLSICFSSLGIVHKSEAYCQGTYTGEYPVILLSELKFETAAPMGCLQCRIYSL